MNIILGVLAFTVAVLAVLQGWNMRKSKNNNPGNHLTEITGQLGIISGQLGSISNRLGRMEQRLNDVWDKVKEE